MASFSTHLSVGAFVSAAVGFVFAHASVVSTPRACLLAAVGTVGSLLPDIDAGNSVPARWIRTVVATSMAVLAGLMLWPSQRIPAVAAWSLLTLVGCHALVGRLIARFTVHRGVIHSVPFAMLVGAALVAGAHRLGGWRATDAWHAGAFLTAGFLVHLCLDEVASVDLTSVRIKRSFGTALKLWSRDNRLGAGALYLALALVAARLPSPIGFLRDVEAVARHTWPPAR